MHIETLAAIPAIIRAVFAANDNAPPTEPPVVRTLRRRPSATYACSENVILPLAFAERMEGWRRVGSPGR
jgi:hypothetical protein